MTAHAKNERQDPLARVIEAPLPTELLLRIHDVMLQSRVLEDRLIRMQSQGDGYFWVGGPGEEAFNVPLGLLVHKGEGLDYDFLHLHYRSAAVMLAMGAKPIDSIRQMRNTSTDPYSGGRNFVSHYSIKEWNVVPVSSPIEVQYSMGIGTGIAHRRHGGQGITIVTGGDAGTAEGDFATSLIWSSLPGRELPMLLIVTNNGWGISTPAASQHAEARISDRGLAFGIESKTIDGNDPEVSYRELARAMDYVRTQRRPFLLEVHVSRLHGHSSSSGANFVGDEVDPLARFEHRLEERGLVSRARMNEMRAYYNDQLLEGLKTVRREEQPDGSTIFDHVLADGKPSRFGA